MNCCRTRSQAKLPTPRAGLGLLAAALPQSDAAVQRITAIQASSALAAPGLLVTGLYERSALTIMAQYRHLR